MEWKTGTVEKNRHSQRNAGKTFDWNDNTDKKAVLVQFFQLSHDISVFPGNSTKMLQRVILYYWEFLF